MKPAWGPVSAAFLIRTYAPEISMGLHTDDELIDMAPTAAQAQPASSLSAVRSLIDGKAAAQKPGIDQETGEIEQPASNEHDDFIAAMNAGEPEA